MIAIWMGSATAQAETYSQLVSEGYRTGPLSRNVAGIDGWRVTKGGKGFFCKRNVAMAYVGRDGLVVITSAGRRIKANRKVWEAGRGGPDPSLPQLSDLQKGRVRPQHVGACSAASR